MAGSSWAHARQLLIGRAHEARSVEFTFTAVVIACGSPTSLVLYYGMATVVVAIFTTCYPLPSFAGCWSCSPKPLNPSLLATPACRPCCLQELPPPAHAASLWVLPNNCVMGMDAQFTDFFGYQAADLEGGPMDALMVDASCLER